MAEKPFKVYVIQGRSERDYRDCQAALAAVPAHLEALPFLRQEEDIIAQTSDADALIVSSSPITRRVMSALPYLKVVVRTGVGYDVIDVQAATDLGIVVVNIPDLWVREVANHALALLLAWNRKLLTLNSEVKSGVWQSRVPGRSIGSLHGETVGIVGFGNIGKAFARRVAALETHVIAYDPYVDVGQFTALGVERVASLGELAARADYVSVHTLLNAETRHLINEAFLRQMKPTACLINTSRGPVVDEQALIRALQEQWIAGAALDVREQEPPAPDSPLSQMDNVILTPHAAYFSTPAVAQVPQRCGEEVARVLTGQRPLHVVNPEAYAALRQPMPH
jgi:D-3-phosphoglycerate dehydrogenase / 2-oxoglutarate reductase